MRRAPRRDCKRAEKVRFEGERIGPEAGRGRRKAAWRGGGKARGER